MEDLDVRKAATIDSATLAIGAGSPPLMAIVRLCVVGRNAPRVALTTLRCIPVRAAHLPRIVDHLCATLNPPAGKTTLAWASVLSPDTSARSSGCGRITHARRNPVAGSGYAATARSEQASSGTRQRPLIGQTAS